MPICDKNTCNIYDIGTKVRVKLDNPIGNKLHGKFRNSDIRFSKEVHTITDIILSPHQPPLYELDDSNKALYTKPDRCI